MNCDHPPKGHQRIVVLTAARNEGMHLLEWVIYHKLIGVSDIVLATNGCDDGSDTLAARLAEIGLVHHIDVSISEGEKPQQACYNEALKLCVVQEADWLSFIDVDEFINVKIGAHQITDLIDAIYPANIISLNWRTFGSDGKKSLDGKLTIESFENCAEPCSQFFSHLLGFKSIFKPEFWSGFGVHRPKKPTSTEGIKWVNGSGLKMPDRYIDHGWKSNQQTFGDDLAQINHYAVRSRDDYIAKLLRGHGQLTSKEYDLSYWTKFNLGGVTDTSISWAVPQLKKQKDELLRDKFLNDTLEEIRTYHKLQLAEFRSHNGDVYSTIDSSLKPLRPENAARKIRRDRRLDIVTFWTGGPLQALELCCLNSWIKLGHKVRLFSWENNLNVPNGVELCDAAEILPKDRLFLHERKKSPAVFSDIFRLQLLSTFPNAIWLDTDVYLYGDLNQNDGYVFAEEKPGQIANAVMKFGKNSRTLRQYKEFVDDPPTVVPFLNAVWQEKMSNAAKQDRPLSFAELPWGTTGPLALTYFLKENGEYRYKNSLGDIVYLPRKEVPIFFDENPAHALRRVINCRALHLSGSVVRNLLNRYGGEPPASSFLAQLLGGKSIAGIRRDAVKNTLKRSPTQLNAPPPKAKTNLHSSKNKQIGGAVTDVLSAEGTTGLIRAFSNHNIIYNEISSDRLVVTFEHLGSHRVGGIARSPWKYGLWKKLGFSVLGVTAHHHTWYREKAIVDYLRFEFNKGLFKSFSDVAFVGSSMGGYGALAFSALRPGSRCIAFSPQISLDDRVVPWETRWRNGSKQDWLLPLSDARGSLRKNKETLIFYDRYHEMDRRHVEAIPPGMSRNVNVMFHGHSVVWGLQRMDLLDYVLSESVAGNFDQTKFYRKLRQRHDMPYYSFAFKKFAEMRGKADLGAAYRRIFKKNQRNSK